MERLKTRFGTTSETIVNIYLLIIAAAAIGIVSGIGSTCTTFDLFTMGGSSWWVLDSFSIIEKTQLFFIASYIVTWAVAIAWGVLYWALQRGKTWFYQLAFVTSIAGIISGFIPSWILYYEYWQSYGVTGMPFTPSWFRTIINIIILFVLLIPRVRSGLGAHIEEVKASSGGSLGSDVSQFAFVFFGFGSILIAYGLTLPIIHAVWADVILFLGIDFGSLLFFSGLLCILLGTITLIVGRLITMNNSSKPTIT